MPISHPDYPDWDRLYSDFAPLIDRNRHSYKWSNILQPASDQRQIGMTIGVRLEPICHRSTSVN